jgi:hypothetical protein
MLLRLLVVLPSERAKGNMGVEHGRKDYLLCRYPDALSSS